MADSLENMVETGTRTGRRRVSLSDVPKVHGETALQKVGGRWVAATPDDQLHSFEGPDGVVSEVGERIVELIDGRRTVADIVEALLSDFEVTREVAELDTLDFIGLLAEKHVLSL
jgi:Coenzyme PQQ synthesis protein D (PqqD)